jgi:hypothetical protein
LNFNLNIKVYIFITTHLKMPVIKATDLDLSKLTFSEVKTDNNGRKMVFVNLNGGKVIVQTPKMYVPNGIKRWRKKDAVDNKDDSFEMEMSFGGEDKQDKNAQAIKTFHEKMSGFDDLVKNHIKDHSKELLGKPKVTMELIENAFHTPVVRLAMDKEGNVLDYPSRVRVKLDRERSGDDFTGRFLSCKRPATEILMYDQNKSQLPMNEDNFETVVPKNSQVVAVLELVYLTITTKVSAKWKLVQAKVERNQTNITGYAMLDDEDETPDLDSETPVEALVTQTAKVTVEDPTEEVETGEEEDELDDELDDDLDEEDEPEPVPAPVPVKKGRAKKV